MKLHLALPQVAPSHLLGRYDLRLRWMANTVCALALLALGYSLLVSPLERASFQEKWGQPVALKVVDRHTIPAHQTYAYRGRRPSPQASVRVRWPNGATSVARVSPQAAGGRQLYYWQATDNPHEKYYLADAAARPPMPPDNWSNYAVFWIMVAAAALLVSLSRPTAATRANHLRFDRATI